MLLLLPQLLLLQLLLLCLLLCLLQRLQLTATHVLLSRPSPRWTMAFLRVRQAAIASPAAGPWPPTPVATPRCCLPVRPVRVVVIASPAAASGLPSPPATPARLPAIWVARSPALRLLGCLVIAPADPVPVRTTAAGATLEAGRGSRCCGGSCGDLPCYVDAVHLACADGGGQRVAASDGADVAPLALGAVRVVGLGQQLVNDGVGPDLPVSVHVVRVAKVEAGLLRMTRGGGVG